MKLGAGLFVAYLLICALCFTYPIARIADSLRTRYLEGLEEPLVDQANILAAVVGREMEAGRFAAEDLRRALDEAHARRLTARIYDMEKERVDVEVYITDVAGKIVFDSRDPENPGADYSEWRDVLLTLRGEYGARTTRADPNDPASSVLYVAAPIVAGGETVGVLTVAEPTTSVNEFLVSAKSEVFRIGALSALSAVGLSLLVSFWVSREIRRLTRYANDVREGRRVDLPRLARTELREMGNAFDRMRESLEGKKYVERYVQTLTHEIKSPVSAIQGAAELLGEEMPPGQRARFLQNIRSEAGRIQDLVERMLKLSELESRKTLETMEVVPLGPLIRTVLQAKEPMLSRKKLDVRTGLEEGVSIKGDPFLLHQAISNLLQNAIDFSPEGGRLCVRTDLRGPVVSVTVEDEGPGIPQYAKEKVFEKFFSLARPDTGKKSTGLGLNFVREVAVLHQGEVRLENLAPAGVRASLSLPVFR
jgi:two-component system sensor histidine kinase CreC